MINTNDIRRGLFFNTPRKDQNPFRIDEIEYLGKKDCKVGMEVMPNAHPLTWYLKDLQPIPLTAEVLEQWCGFEEHYSSGMRKAYAHQLKGFVGVEIYEKGSVYCQEGGIRVRYYSETIKEQVLYLHQLQNAFKVLTGTELEVKLPSPLHEQNK